MKLSFSKFLNRIESDRTGFLYWAVSLFAIILIRSLLDGLLEEGELLDLASFFINYALAYLVIFLGVLAALRLFIRESAERIFKVLTVFFLLILVVPVIDFAASSGQGYELKFAIGDAGYITNAFLTSHSQSSTLGQKIEATALGLLLIAYLFTKTRSILRTVAGAGLCYVTFFLLTIPHVWIYAASCAFFDNPIQPQFDPSGALADSHAEDFIAYITPNMVRASFFLFTAFCVALLAHLSNRRSLRTLKGLARPARIAHYLMLGAFGLLLGHSVAGGMAYPLHDCFFSAVFLTGGFFLYQFASLANDLFDMDFEKRSRIRRAPETLDAMRAGAVFSAVISLGLAYTLNSGVIVLFSALIALAFLYSAPPLRLKRFPLASSFAIAMCALLGVMAGFAVFAQDATVKSFPSQVALAILVVYTLGVNYKDLKDVDADRKGRVYTVPVLVGERRGEAVVSAMVAASFLLVPFILGIDWLWAPSAAAAILSITFIRLGLGERYFRAMLLAYLAFVAYAVFAANAVA